MLQTSQKNILSKKTLTWMFSSTIFEISKELLWLCMKKLH